MALFQVIKYNGPANVLVWKHPKENITTAARARPAALDLQGRACIRLCPPA